MNIPKPPTRWTVPILASGIAALLALMLLPSLSGFGFSIDDGCLISIPLLRQPLTWHSLVELFTPGAHVDYYPARDLSYWLDIHLFGGNPYVLDASVFRMHNLALLAISASLLGAILSEMGYAWTGIIISLLWGIHPVHFETIIWSSARKDILAILFALLAVLSFLKWLNGKGERWILICGAGFGLSLLSKASFSLLPGLGWIWYFLWKPGKAPATSTRSHEKGRIPSALVALSLVGCASALFQSWFYANVNDMRIFHPWEYRWRASAIAFARMAAGWLDIRQNVIDVEHWGDWVKLNQGWLLPGITLWIMTGAAFLLSLLRKSKEWILIWSGFLLLYIPISGLGYAHQKFYSVRYFEVPLLALVIGIGARMADRGSRWSAKARKWMIGATVACFLALLSVGFIEAPHWSSGPAMMDKSLALSPENPALLFVKLTELHNLKRWGRLGEAELEMTRSLEEELIRRCDVSKRGTPSSGDLCWSFWNQQLLTNSKLSRNAWDRIHSALESRLVAFAPEGQWRWRARARLLREEQEGKIEPATARYWLEHMRNPWMPKWKIDYWLALCMTGQEDLAKERLKRFMDHHLLDRGEWIEFLSSYGKLWNWLDQNGFAGRCGLLESVDFHPKKTIDQPGS